MHHGVMYFTACGANCKSCNSNKEGNCDSNQCNKGYVLNTETKKCICE